MKAPAPEIAETADHRLDITADICPMTFVRTRLLIEKMAAGDVAEIRLRGEEPLKNVPDSVAELGHDILSLEPQPDQPPDGLHLLRIRKN